MFSELKVDKISNWLTGDLHQYKQFVIVYPQIDVLLFAEQFTYMH